MFEAETEAEAKITPVGLQKLNLPNSANSFGVKGKVSRVSITLLANSFL